VAMVGVCYEGQWASWLLDRRKRGVGHIIYSPALCVPPSPSGQCGTPKGVPHHCLHAPSTEQALVVAAVVGVHAWAKVGVSG
jgi:hypothetical protein